MKRGIALCILLIATFSFAGFTKHNATDDKFMYIIARPNSKVNQSSNYFFSTVIRYQGDKPVSNFFTNAGRIFFMDVAIKYNLVSEDWKLEFVGDGSRKKSAHNLKSYFGTKAKAETARAADIKKLSNKTGGKYEVIETPYPEHFN